MWKKVAIVGAVAAAIVGSGAAALATSGGSSLPPPSSPAAGVKATKARGLGVLRGALHGTWVTRDGKSGGSFVQHDSIRGQVTEVSATSITVKAADGVSMVFLVDSSTKVRVKSGTAIGDVHDGDQVGVLGTGSSTMTATRVVGAGALARGLHRQAGSAGS